MSFSFSMWMSFQSFQFLLSDNEPTKTKDIIYSICVGHQKAPNKQLSSANQKQNGQNSKNTKYFHVSFNHHPTNLAFLSKAPRAFQSQHNLKKNKKINPKKKKKKKQRNLSFTCHIGPYKISKFHGLVNMSVGQLYPYSEMGLSFSFTRQLAQNQNQNQISEYI